MNSPLIKAPQDNCWDTNCPIDPKDPVATIKRKKLDCLKRNRHRFVLVATT